MFSPFETSSPSGQFCTRVHKRARVGQRQGVDYFSSPYPCKCSKMLGNGVLSVTFTGLYVELKGCRICRLRRFPAPVSVRLAPKQKAYCKGGSRRDTGRPA